MERPWANGLARLLADRRLKKGDLAELAGVRAGTVSAVANSPKAPDVATLKRLADGLTKYDRQARHNAPVVQLWEFFVSDDQAALLRQTTQAQHKMQREQVSALVSQEIENATDRILAALNGSPAPQQAIDHHSTTPPTPPAEHLARGRLHGGKKTA